MGETQHSNAAPGRHIFQRREHAAHGRVLVAVRGAEVAIDDIDDGQRGATEVVDERLESLQVLREGEEALQVALAILRHLVHGFDYADAA